MNIMQNAILIKTPARSTIAETYKDIEHFNTLGYHALVCKKEGNKYTATMQGDKDSKQVDSSLVMQGKINE